MQAYLLKFKETIIPVWIVAYLKIISFVRNGIYGCGVWCLRYMLVLQQYCCNNQRPEPVWLAKS